MPFAMPAVERFNTRMRTLLDSRIGDSYLISAATG